MEESDVKVSGVMEAMHNFFHKGFAELDDVMHNTVGCIIGWCMVKSSRLSVNSWR